MTPEASAAASPSPAVAGGHEVGWYVYGIQRSADAPPAVVAGIADAPVESVVLDRLRALVSRVATGEFSEAALRVKADDLEWLTRNAYAHEAVLIAALNEGPVLPVRFGTVFRDRQAIEQLLGRHCREFHAEADRIAGYTEWAAKVLVDAAVCDRWIKEHVSGIDTGAAASERGGAGRRYLMQRQAEGATREARRVLLDALAAECHDRLSTIGVDASTNPIQPPKVSGYDGQMILNGAYLLDEASILRFHGAATALAKAHVDKGVRIDITGPWPPHHFISLPPIDTDLEDVR